jgi:hypothetical protein
MNLTIEELLMLLGRKEAEIYGLSKELQRVHAEHAECATANAIASEDAKRPEEK